MNKLLGLTFLLISIMSCDSVEKYNAHIDKQIKVAELRKDVDYAKHILLTKHVDIDWYYPKNVIESRLDSFKNSIQQPMQPQTFARDLSKVIATFGHAHTSISFPFKKLTRNERKNFKKSKSPFSLIEIKTIDHNAYLNKNWSKDSTLHVPTELLAINGLTYQDFYKQYKGTRIGDGYIKTFGDYALRGMYISEVWNNTDSKDSIILTLRKNDSVFTKIVKREYKEIKDKHQAKERKNDSVIIEKTEKPNKLTKEQKQHKKDLYQHQAKIKKYFVYNKTKNDYQRELIFPNKEDSTTVLLKIKTFSISHGKKAYPFIFDSIQKLNVKNLILDLRDNTGGYVSEINYLYSFLTTNDIPQSVHADEVRVNAKNVMFNRYFRQPNIATHTVMLPYVLYHATKSYFKTKKKEDGYYLNITSKKNKLNQEHKYKGNLYVLANGLSFSASTILSSSLQNEGKAIFVGEETGGDFNGTVAGQFNDYKTPHTKLTMNIGIMTYKPNASRDLKGRGNLPDVPIRLTLENILKKEDPQLDWIINDIKLKN